ncbi:sn-glycerol-3-phosphate ABC transporter ATP-binding protein UgpC [bacterium]|nr:sn-glycerol-3-phosphate ABC transporter ATP-binding protein UgpC [bacterium]
MAGVRLVNVNKIYPGRKISRPWYEFWRPREQGPDVHVVKDANIEIADGEFLVLVGASGCGKSTTLRMVAGLEDITSGDIFIGDRRVNDVSPKDRDIAMVFQSYALYPHFTVFENMAFGLRLRKFPEKEIQERVHNAAELLGIEQLLKRKPKELSGGQRQRVAMGRAIVRKPKVFLMDEPLSNLDAKLRVQMRAELQKLHRQLGVTTIYVTHDQTEAMTLGDRIVLMQGGYIQQHAAPLEMYDRPVNKYVAGFVGSPSMNFLKCNFVAADGQPKVVGSGFEVALQNERFAVLKNKAAGLNGQPVWFGIRPEDIYDAKMAHPQGSCVPLKATVEVFEPMGSEVYLHVNIGGSMVVARIDARTSLRVGDDADLRLDLSKAHLFEGKYTVDADGKEKLSDGADEKSLLL